MPLFQYFGWVGTVLLAALFAASWWLPGNVADAPPARAPLSESIHIRIRPDHKWPERVVFDTNAGLAPTEYAQAQTEPQDQKARLKPVAVERHDPIEAFAEMRETVEGCLQPPCSADQNRESSASPNRKTALLRSHPAVSRAARAFTAPNLFHRLPGKS
ncbi:MAG: hypothetical protein QOJ15_4510 [Bradyrhizobium sp.]|jgi:hypothetical protein|nr:hypothetical protein [Bradyrhizobium sp.]